MHKRPSAKHVRGIHFRLGSKTDLVAPICDVCSYPDSGHIAAPQRADAQGPIAFVRPSPRNVRLAADFRNVWQAAVFLRTIARLLGLGCFAHLSVTRHFIVEACEETQCRCHRSYPRATAAVLGRRYANCFWKAATLLIDMTPARTARASSGSRSDLHHALAAVLAG